MMKTPFSLALVFGAVLILAGCEWDNSGDTTSSGGAGDSSPPESDGSGSGTPDSSDDTTFLSGRAVGAGPLSDAAVCIDIDSSGSCDEGEPHGRTDSDGRFSIELPDDMAQPSGELLVTAEANITRDNDTGQVSKDFTISSPIDPNRESQFVSPVTDLVVQEMNGPPQRTLSEAKQAVADRVGTTVDVLSDYVEGKTSSDPAEQSSFKRLDQVARVIQELDNRIQDGISDTDLANVGLDESARDRLAADQIDFYLDDIVEDVSNLPPDETFSPGDILDTSTYDSPVPRVTADDPAELTLDDRIAAAVPSAEDDNPFFYQYGEYERRAYANASSYRMILRRHPYEQGKIYYEALRQVTVDTDVNAATAESQEIIPFTNSEDEIVPVNLAYDGRLLCTNNLCNSISYQPQSFRTLTWAGTAFKEAVVKYGNFGRLSLGEAPGTGGIIASAFQGGIPVQQHFTDLSVSGLPAKSVLPTLFAGHLPVGTFSEITDLTEFPAGAKVWRYQESIAGSLRFAHWPTSGVTCGGPDDPEVSDVVSCNLVYGYSPTGQAARTLSDLTYPSAAEGATFNGAEGQSIPLEGPGDNAYALRIFGDPSAPAGTLQIDRENDDGSWTTVEAGMKWERETAPFTHLVLHIPDSYSYAAAQRSFMRGRPIVFERLGYVRSGWLIEGGTDAEALFGRRPTDFTFNQTAVDFIHEKLVEWELLEQHPYYFDLSNISI